MKRSSKISSTTSSYPVQRRVVLTPAPNTQCEKRFSPAVHPCSAFDCSCLKKRLPWYKKALFFNVAKTRRMMCHARYPETPNAPVLGVPSSICKEIDYVRQ
ncbi:hypothetical protein IF1G_03691 [Cordyceps javanica]|uniref:Uncharacterized protein n=1 Tax=Cordyceps javanica TaxID=43265 RepID=A0A545V896_9HYPO|nr:hypothetical protein IF1G_03691 [Cordyceps javanica]